jgi:hypothetical protein
MTYFLDPPDVLSLRQCCRSLQLAVDSGRKDVTLHLNQLQAALYADLREQQQEHQQQQEQQQGMRTPQSCFWRAFAKWPNLTRVYVVGDFPESFIPRLVQVQHVQHVSSMSRCSMRVSPRISHRVPQDAVRVGRHADLVRLLLELIEWQEPETLEPLPSWRLGEWGSSSPHSWQGPWKAARPPPSRRVAVEAQVTPRPLPAR